MSYEDEVTEKEFNKKLVNYIVIQLNTYSGTKMQSEKEQLEYARQLANNIINRIQKG